MRDAAPRAWLPTTFAGFMAKLRGQPVSIVVFPDVNQNNVFRRLTLAGRGGGPMCTVATESRRRSGTQGNSPPQCVLAKLYKTPDHLLLCDG